MTKTFSQVVATEKRSPTNVTMMPDTAVMAKSYACVVLALLKNDEVPGSFDKTLNGLFQANKLPTLCLDGYEPPSSKVLSSCSYSVNAISADADQSTDVSRDELDLEAGSSPRAGVDACATISAPASVSTPSPVPTPGLVSTPGSVSTSGPVSTPSRLEDMRKVKIFKKKGTTICDGADLMRAFDEGKVVVMRGDGPITDPSDISAITNTMFDIPSIILELNNTEFSKHVKPIARNLRKNASKIPNK
jgi:hypothetical protein